MNNSTYYNGKLNVLGKKIKHYREKCELSQQGLSNRLQLLGIDIPKSSIQRIEKGKRVIRDYEIAGLAKVLKIPVDTLFQEFINKL